MTLLSLPSSLPWSGVTHGEEETVAVGRVLASHLGPGRVAALHGDLGAGKTCLVRGLAEGLGAEPRDVHSPSFALVHLYRDAAGRPALFHVDLYRVEGDLALREIGLEEILGGDTPAAIEWPERLAAGRYRPAPGDLEVRLSLLSPQERRIEIRPAV